MVLSPVGLRPDRDCTGENPAATVNYRPVLSSEKALQYIEPQLFKAHFKEKYKLVAGSRWVPDTKTDWPTDCQSKCDFDFGFKAIEKYVLSKASVT
jgi:hypothetical protein